MFPAHPPRRKRCWFDAAPIEFRGARDGVESTRRYARLAEYALVEALTCLGSSDRSHGDTALYPDSPLGDEEIDMLSSLERKIKTPSQRAGLARL